MSTEIPNIGKKQANTQVQKVNNNVQTFKGMPTTRINEILDTYKDSLKNLMNSPERAARMIQIMSTSIKRNPQLQECSPSSIIGGMLQAAMLNLDFNPSLGLCYLVPYGKEAQFQLGYRGMITLAHRSKEILEIYAEVVYEDDEFYIEYGLNRVLTHVPKFLHIGNSEKIKYVYAVAKTKDGGTFYTVLSKPQIEALRKRSPMQKFKMNGAWATDYGEMAKAKAIKQLFKYLPSNAEYNYSVFTDGMIVKSTDTKAENLDYISEHEIEEAEIIEDKNDTQTELTDEEWFKQNADEIAKTEKELFEGGK